MLVIDPHYEIKDGKPIKTGGYTVSCLTEEYYFKDYFELIKFIYEKYELR